MEIRFNPPSRFTKAKFMTLVKVIGETVGDEVEYTVYVQTSRDEENVKWVEAGEVLFIADEHMLLDHKYLEGVMSRYEARKGIKEGNETNDPSSSTSAV